MDQGDKNTAGKGSLSEWRLLARNLLMLPGGFRGRPMAPLMTGDGWRAERPVSARHRLPNDLRASRA